MGKKRLILLGSLGLFLLTGSILGIFFWSGGDGQLPAKPIQQGIPTAIRAQLNFAPLSVKAQNRITDISSAKFDVPSKLLTYIQYMDGAKLIISQQPSPDAFSDVPQYFNALTDKLHGKESFDSVNGQVHIVYPTELKGGQTAIMNTKGT